MREDDTHGPSVKNLLNEAIATLVGDSHKRSDSGLESSHAQSAGIINAEGRMLKLDEQAVESGILC